MHPRQDMGYMAITKLSGGGWWGESVIGRILSIIDAFNRTPQLQRQ